MKSVFDSIQNSQNSKISQEELNEISLQEIAEKYFQKGVRLNHYLVKNSNQNRSYISSYHAKNDEKSQTKFSIYSHYFFCQLAEKYKKKFNQEIFPRLSDLDNIDSRKILISETKPLLEEFYRDICNARVALAHKTSEKLELSIEDKNLLAYQESSTSTYTTISSNPKYHKYSSKISKADDIFHLPLNSCLIALDEKSNSEIYLGTLYSEKDNKGMRKTIHEMGSYRKLYNINENKLGSESVARILNYRNLLQDENSEIEPNETVDDITTLSMLKSLQAFQNNQSDKALKYALVFNVLRGYNLRSVIGACWCQEMSTRVLLNSIDQHYFNKMPDVFLDIAACCIEPSLNNLDSLSKMLDRQAMEIIDKNNPNLARDFFDYDQNLNYQTDLNSYRRELASHQELENNLQLLENKHPAAIQKLIEQETSFKNLFKKDFAGKVFIFEVLKNFEENQSEDKLIYQKIFENIADIIESQDDEDEKNLTKKYLFELINFATDRLDEKNKLSDAYLFFLENLIKSSFEKDFLINENYKFLAIKSAIQSSDFLTLEKIISSSYFSSRDLNMKIDEDNKISLFEVIITTSVENKNLDFLEKIFNSNLPNSSFLKENKFNFFDQLILNFDENFAHFFANQNSRTKDDFHLKLTEIIVNADNRSNILTTKNFDSYNTKLSIPHQDGYFNLPYEINKILGNHFNDKFQKKPSNIIEGKAKEGFLRAKTREI